MTITHALTQAPKYQHAFKQYILCEQNFPTQYSPCDRTDIERYGNPLPVFLPFLAVELLPAVLLLFVMNVEAIKRFFRTKSRRGLAKTSTNMSLDI